MSKTRAQAIGRAAIGTDGPTRVETPAPAPAPRLIANAIIENDAADRYADAIALLQDGDVNEALLATAALLRQPGDTFTKLYLHGLAQLRLADSTGQAEHYKDAALSFMRVVVWLKPEASLVGPSMLEAARCHVGFQRPAKALDMLLLLRNPEAGPLLDAEAEPHLTRHMEAMIAELTAGP